MRSSLFRLDKPWFWVVLITAMAALLRLFAIGELPPGLYHDEAYNGLDALGVWQGQTPLFFEANNGREPLYIYLQAISVALLGRTPAALRLVSALLGTVTIPIIYILGRELYGSRVGLVAALLCATTVWTLNLSRIGFRAVAFPPLMALSLAYLWRGLHQSSPRRGRRSVEIAIAGLLYGLTFYTYLTARFTVIAMLLFFAHTWMHDRHRVWMRGWALFALVALLTMAPLALYLAQHGQGILGRITQVSILNPAINQGNLLATFGRHLWLTLRAFVDRGDFIPRHNVPLRPVFDPLVGLAFWVGVMLSLWRARRQTPYALGVTWLGVMLLPTVLAEDAPHFLRASGILPVLFFFPAVGLMQMWNLLQRPRLAVAGSAILCLILISSAVSNVAAYWRHVHSEAAYFNFEAGATALAVDINRFLGSGWQGEGFTATGDQPEEGRKAYITPRLWENWASVRYLCPQSSALETILPDAQPAKRTDARDVLLLLWPFEDHREALTLLPPGGLIAAREGAQERGDLETQSRLLYFTLRREPAENAPHSADARWEQGIRLLGYTIAQQGMRQLLVTLYWQSDAPLSVSYTVFAHAYCAGERVGQHDGPPAGGYYPTDRWRASDTVTDQHVVPLSADYDAARCRVLVGIYRWETMERVRLLDARGQQTEETALVLEATHGP